MTQTTMRRLERWVGKPACALLTGVRAIRRAFRAERSVLQFERPRKVLLLKLIEQGASVLAFSAIEETIRQVGAKNVYFWVFEENKEIVRVLGLIPDENLIVLSHKTPWAFLSSLGRNLRAIRRADIDAVVDMEFYSRASAILAYLTGAAVRVGLHRFTSEAPFRGDLFTHRIAYNPFLHTSKAYLQLVRVAFEPALTVPGGKMPASELLTRNPVFVPTVDDTMVVRRIIADCLGEAALADAATLILLNPNASDLLPIRKWPTDRFHKLAHRLLGESESTFILLTGAPSERATVEAIAREIGHPRCASVAGRTTLRQLFTLYDESDILVTNDSGPGHFASMTRVDSIVLFGPETPSLFGPMGRHSHTVWKELACSPCVNPLNHRLSPCDDAVCMKTISVEEIHGRIHQCLDNRRADQTVDFDVPRTPTWTTENRPSIQ